MLGFGAESRRQSEAAAEALQRLKQIVARLDLAHIAISPKELNRKIETWFAEPDDQETEWRERHFSWCNDHPRKPTVHCTAGNTREERCSAFISPFEYLFGANMPGIRLIRELSEADAVLLELGQCLDRGLRPANVHLNMWDDAIGSQGPNRLANCSRQAGELPLESGWEIELRALLMRAGVASNFLVDANIRDVIGLVDALDDAVRATIHPEKPYWDSASRTLRVDDVIIKDFSKQQRGGRQEKLFQAFQDSGWVEKVPNPFTTQIVGQGIKPSPNKNLLQETVKSANKRQKVTLIQFAVIDSAESVCWKLIPQKSNQVARKRRKKS